ncbi:MAG: ABC transporter six-transmembrane domain-containing protein [Pseudomonadota bacterium]
MQRFRWRITLTWFLTLCETALMALIPLLIGLAIDDLLADAFGTFWYLALLMATLIVVAVLRRLYDTRVYATLRVELARAQVKRSTALAVSTLNARLGMGHELVDFLEHTLPDAMAAAVHLLIAVIVLYLFSPTLTTAAGVVALLMVLIYAVFHRRFFRLSGALNQQTEQQVSILARRKPRAMRAHLLKLRRVQVQVSDAEALLYGLIFVVLLALILFNLWFSATQISLTPGRIFSIVSYSWEFVDSALALPMTLQTWSRLSEITRRLNPLETVLAPNSN